MSNPSPQELAGLLDRVGVSVKPLEWVHHGDWTVTADTPFGVRKIYENRGQWFNEDATAPNHGPFNELDDAKAAQLRVYEARIFSSLKASSIAMEEQGDA